MSGELIADFWENKDYFIKNNILKQKAREFYTEDFIANYNKWKNNLQDLNNVIKEYLIENEFNMKYWTDITYDEFCKLINDNIEEWITVNNDIEINDLTIITQNLIDVHLDKIIKIMNENKYTLSSLFESIKKVKY